MKEKKSKVIDKTQSRRNKKVVALIALTIGNVLTLSSITFAWFVASTKSASKIKTFSGDMDVQIQKVEALKYVYPYYNNSAEFIDYGGEGVVKSYVVEDISIAVTLDRNNLPTDTTLEELKELIARAASPKVSADNVSIAFTNSSDPYLTPEKTQNLPKVDDTGNPWWLAIIFSAIGLIIIFKAISAKLKRMKEENEMEVESLRQRALAQERALNDVNDRASQSTQRQAELAQDLLNQQQMRAALPEIDPSLLEDSLDRMSGELSEEVADKIKSWIEEGQPVTGDK
jgi:hypothetical protein